ncbi:MAG: 2Fe-2S iron-sulfur cluster-binding protein [Gammaproteobacteria bacterium]|nr:2Fe-2S iron-sulfur cluster-binding protein [Gammaproteobacteria bacterium]
MNQYSFKLVYDKTDSTGIPYPLERGQTLLKNLLLNNITPFSKCGGKAICGLCRVQVLSGKQYCNKPVIEETNILSNELIEEGWRLACQLYCLKDVQLYLPSKEEIEHMCSSE